MILSWLRCALFTRWALLPVAPAALGLAGCSHHHHDYHERQRVVVLRDEHPRHGYYDGDGCWHEYARYDDPRLRSAPPR